MAEAGSRSIAREVLVGGLGILLGTFLGMVGYFYFTQEKPELAYEIFPPSSFTSEDRRMSILNIRIENQGNDVAERVRSVFQFPDGAEVVDYNVQLSSPAIRYQIEDSLGGRIGFTLPTLNPSENAKFSFLVRGSEKVEVGVRAEGVTGKERVGSTGEERIEPLDVVVLLMLVFTCGAIGWGLVDMIISRREWKAEKEEFEDLLTYLKSSGGNE